MTYSRGKLTDRNSDVSVSHADKVFAVLFGSVGIDKEARKLAMIDLNSATFLAHP